MPSSENIPSNERCSDGRKLSEPRPSLSPCPFCGNAKSVTFWTAADAHSDCENDGGNDMWSIAAICDFNAGGCGASSGFQDSQADAAEAWNTRAQQPETNDKRVITEEIRIGSTVCKPGCRMSTVLNRIERGFQFAEARRDPSIVGVVPALQEAPVETEAPPASHREVRGILAGYTPVETAENSVERRARDNFNLSHGIDAGAWDRQHESEKDRWRDAARRQVKASGESSGKIMKEP